jgi:integrase
MARVSNSLTKRSVEAAAPGRHADGGGLWLDVSASGSRRWLFIYRWEGRRPEMGLGGFPAVSLADARDKAVAARKLIAGRINPLEARVIVRAIPTFGKVGDELIASLENGWRNPKTAIRWRATLASHAAPLLPKAVDQITTEDVLAVLTPLWTAKPHTAGKARGIIERVLDAAKARKFRSGENPAAWRGHLKLLLSARPTLTRGHYPALPWQELPAFIATLRKQAGIGALAVEFAILTAARSGEVRGATWDEFDLDTKVWMVPGKRMKTGKMHQVPLVPRAVQIIELVARLPRGTYVFPGSKKNRPLSDMTLSAVLKRMNFNVTVHGYRATFRMWCGDTGAAPREIAEAALSHVISNQVEAAYNRSTALERRRALMLAWAQFCEAEAASGV